MWISLGTEWLQKENWSLLVSLGLFLLLFPLGHRVSRGFIQGRKKKLDRRKDRGPSLVVSWLIAVLCITRPR